MAIYEYICETCDDDIVFERRVHIANRDEQFCDECGTQLTLVPSVPARVTPGKYGKGGQQ